MMVPATFAATSSSSVQWKTLNITAGSSYSANPEGFSGYDHGSTTLTTFAPIYYVKAALQALGYTVTWDGTSLMVNTPAGVTPDFSGISVGTGNTNIYVNGTLVKKVYSQVKGDPASGGKIQTTYVPIYYIDALLKAAGESAQWDGSGWALTAPTTATTGASFSSLIASGNQTGSGSQTSPAVSSNGGAVTLTTTLSDNGVPAANTAVNVTVSGSSTPVIQANGTYVTATPNSAGTSWTFTANTDSTGKLAVSVVGTGAYTVSFADASNTTVTATGYINFLGTGGLLTPYAANSASAYSADISTVSSTSAGVVPVTYTLPLNSSGQVQVGQEVTFKLNQTLKDNGNSVPTNAFFSTASGQEIGTTYTAYSNSEGQITLYVNDFTADTTEVDAYIGSDTTPDAVTYISYSNPDAPTGSYALNNIGVFAFSSSVANATTSSPNAVAGLPESGTAYFAPVDAGDNAYGTKDGSITYTINATNGAYIQPMLDLSSGGWTAANLPASLQKDSSMTLQFELNSAGNAYNVYANGVELTDANGNAYSVGSPVFGVQLSTANATGNSSTVTVAAGKVNASATFNFNGTSPVNVTSFTPVIGSLSGAGSTQTVSFVVDDANGNPVANAPVTVVIPQNTSLKGEWITAVNGNQLTEPLGTNGSSVYTPIPLDQTDANVAYNVGIPNVANWNSSSSTDTTLTVYTDANGKVSLTFQNGDVWYASAASGATNTEDTNYVPSGTNLYAFTPSSAAKEGQLYIQTSSTAPTFTAPTGSSTTPTAIQVGEINN